MQRDEIIYIYILHSADGYTSIACAMQPYIIIVIIIELVELQVHETCAGYAKRFPIRSKRPGNRVVFRHYEFDSDPLWLGTLIVCRPVVPANAHGQCSSGLK